MVVGRLEQYLNNFDAGEPAHEDDDEKWENDRDDADVADDDGLHLMEPTNSIENLATAEIQERNYSSFLIIIFSDRCYTEYFS